jgi:uncharacterized membrane protein (UPF0127 family)
MAHLVARGKRIRRRGRGHGDRIPASPLSFQRSRQLLGADVPRWPGGSYRGRAYDVSRPKVAAWHPHRDSQDFRSSLGTDHDGATGDEYERCHDDEAHDHDNQYADYYHAANVQRYGTRNAPPRPPDPAGLRTRFDTGVHSSTRPLRGWLCLRLPIGADRRSVVPNPGCPGTGRYQLGLLFDSCAGFWHRGRPSDGRPEARSRDRSGVPMGHEGRCAVSARLRALAFRGTAALAVLASASAVLWSAGAGPSRAISVPRGNAVLIVGSHRYYLQLAVTPGQQELGLGGRPKLPLDDGMLFLYHSSATRCFWMKGMKFALDMVWLSSADEVVSVQPNVSPKSYPSAYCTVAQDVVELDAGQARLAGIVVDRVVKLEMP